MRIDNRNSILITLLMMFTGPALLGQGTSIDSTFVERSLGNAIAMYTVSIRDQALLFNGVEYKALPEPYEGFPFFGSEYVEAGSILYDGELYKNIPLQYDLVKDELIIEHYDQKGYVSMIKPHQTKISSFQLLDHTFVRIVGDSTAGVLREGFYDVLYDGGIKVLAKRKKNVSEDISLGQLTVSFIEKNSYYIEKDGKYYSVKNKGSMLKVLQDQKKSLSQFASKNKLNFKDNREGAMAKLAAYYDQTREAAR
jgi:hypothetical protein